MKILGITCGIGSMLIGGYNNGMEVVGNIEWRKYYHVGKPFQKNFKAPMVHKLSDLTTSDRANFQNVDIAFGHPECGNFSNLRVRKTAKLKDAADLPLFAELVLELRPKFFVMDNLPKSLIGFPIEAWKEKLGSVYNLFPEWVSNFHYGNTQINRRRFFLIGALKEYETFTFYPGEFEHNRMLRDAIGDLPNTRDIKKLNHIHRPDNDILRGWGSHNFDLTIGKPHVTLKDFKRVIKKYPDKKNFQYYNRFGETKLRPGYSKIILDNYSPVLSGGGSAPDNHYRSDTLNPLTMRERLRIQGAPDSFTLHPRDYMDDHKTYMALYKQTGKFMPVEFCTYIASFIEGHLENRHIGAVTQRRLIKTNEYIDDAKKKCCTPSIQCKGCWIECDRRVHEQLGPTA
jgi:site-specific DNA-cytosine methylase